MAGAIGFNINELVLDYYQLFGAFRLPPAQDPPAPQPFDAVVVPASDPILGYTDIGTAYYTNAILGPANYRDIDTKGNAITVQVPRVELISPIVEASYRKPMVKTLPAGSSIGSVKQDMGRDDYSLRIRAALCTNVVELYPREQVDALRRICEARTAIPVSGDLFGLLGVYYLAIESYTIGSTPGMRNVAFVDLQCSSDTPLDLLESRVA